MCNLGEANYDERLGMLGLDKLSFRRTINDLIMCRNIVFGYVVLPYSNFFTPSFAVSNRPNPHKIQKVHVSIDSVKYFFSNRVVELWNKLPVSVTSRSTVDSFRSALERFLKC